MPTTKLGLPTITDNMTNDVPRDLNALAEAIDNKAGVPDGLARLGPNGKLVAGQENAVTPPDASTTQKGITMLSNSITGTSETIAATQKAIFDAIANVKDWGQNAVNAGGQNDDPNTTTHSYMLTDHANGPGGGLFWHIQSYFYSSKTGNRGQIALSYSGTIPQLRIRHKFGSTWTPWEKLIGDSMRNVANGFLGLDGNGKVPIGFMPGVMTKISEVSITNGSASVVISNLSAYKKIKLLVRDVKVPNTGQISLMIKVNDTAVIRGTQIIGSTISSVFSSSIGIGVLISTHVSFAEVLIGDGASNNSLVTRGYQTNPTGSDSTNPTTFTGSTNTAGAPVNKVEIYSSSATFTSGTVEVWGEI